MKKTLKDIIVTTGDLKQDYEVIGPIYFQVSNKGIFQAHFKVGQEEMLEEKEGRRRYLERSRWLFFMVDGCRSRSDFEKSIFVAVEEL